MAIVTWGEVGGAELVVADYELGFEGLVCVWAGAGEDLRLALKEAVGEGAGGGEEGEEEGGEDGDFGQHRSC